MATKKLSRPEPAITDAMEAAARRVLSSENITFHLYTFQCTSEAQTQLATKLYHAMWKLDPTSDRRKEVARLNAVGWYWCAPDDHCPQWAWAPNRRAPQ